MASTRSTAGLRAVTLLYLASLSSALPALGDFKYQGCYTDSGDARSLTGKKVLNAKMTLAKCAAACDGYQWFGVEYGSQCYCGDDLASTAAKRPDAECGMRCGGKMCQLCGGADRLSVFWTGRDGAAGNVDAVGGFNYQGCWMDDAKARSLTGSENPRSGMTVEMCAGFCAGFGYFGVENGGECFCGDDLGGKAAAEDQCSQHCEGNAVEWCGGAGYMNLYSAVAPSTTSSALSTTTSSTSSTTTSSISSTTTSEAVSSTSTTVAEPTSTSSTESTTESITDSTTTTTEPDSSTTSASDTTTTTSSPEATPTSADSSPTLPPSTLTPTPTPTPSPSTTTTACDLTTITTLAPTPALCLASIPSPCSSLNRTPALPYVVATLPATQCRNAFLTPGATTAPPAIATCFASLTNPRGFVAASVYSCVAAAASDFLCQTATATVCKEDVAASPTPTNVLGDVDGGFEGGELWPAAVGGNQMGGDDVIAVSVVAGEQVHSGRYAMRVDFKNTNGGLRMFTKSVVFEPGAVYEASWWWWSGNAEASSNSRMQISGGWTNVLIDVGMWHQTSGQWVRVSKQFTAGANFGTVNFSVSGNRADAANTFYIDDISIIKVE